MKARERVVVGHVRKVCQNILQQIMGLENAYFFFRPVNPVADGAPDYFRVIVRPMSFLVVQENLDNEKYTTFDMFAEHMRLIWQNAMVYNHPSHPISKTAGKMWNKFELLAAALPKEIEGGARTSGLQRLVENRFARYRAERSSRQ
jgi:hypothetical protein